MSVTNELGPPTPMAPAVQPNARAAARRETLRALLRSKSFIIGVIIVGFWVLCAIGQARLFQDPYATSLDVLKPHRMALRALIPVLIGDPDDGVFAEGTAFSRLRVQRVFEEAAAGASDAPKAPLGEALGRLLYLIHLAVLLWWLLDRTPRQRATAALVALTEQLLPSATLALRLPPIRRFVIGFDELIREGLFGNAATD